MYIYDRDSVFDAEIVQISHLACLANVFWCRDAKGVNSVSVSRPDSWPLGSAQRCSRGGERRNPITVLVLNFRERRTHLGSSVLHGDVEECLDVGRYISTGMFYDRVRVDQRATCRQSRSRGHGELLAANAIV
jgi:hypothetical protein